MLSLIGPVRGGPESDSSYSTYCPLLSIFAWQALEGAVRIEDKFRKAVVYVGIKKGGNFVPLGTGFVAINFIDDYGFQQIVTAKHIFDGIDDDEIYLRVNRLDGRAEVLPLARDSWLEHPDPAVDLTICGTGIPHDQFDILHLSLESSQDSMVLVDYSLDTSPIGLGDEVFIAGMFIGRLGEVRNLPIIRTGTIAAMPEEKIKTTYGLHEAYLIEARSIDGLSGSPVFAATSLSFVQDGKVGIASGVAVYLIGMLLGHTQVINPSEIIEIAQTAEKPKETKDAIVPLNTGIGLVLPISAVIEAVEQPKLNQIRIDALENKRKTSGYIADSVAVSDTALPTTDENPQHREDFNSLLDAATAGNKSGPETS